MSGDEGRSGGRHHHARTALFYNTYKNFIAYTRYTCANNPAQFTNVPSNIYTIYQAENRDKAYIYGGEISAKFNFGSWFEGLMA